MKIFKIIFLFFLSLFNVALFTRSIFLIITNFKYLISYNFEPIHVLVSTLYQFIFGINNILVVCLCVYLLIIIFKKTNTSNYIKYTYEEYKTKKDRKKALKQEKQKEILKQKLNELEKGE